MKTEKFVLFCFLLSVIVIFAGCSKEEEFKPQIGGSTENNGLDPNAVYMLESGKVALKEFISNNQPESITDNIYKYKIKGNYLLTLTLGKGIGDSSVVLKDIINLKETRLFGNAFSYPTLEALEGLRDVKDFSFSIIGKSPNGDNQLELVSHVKFKFSQMKDLYTDEPAEYLDELLLNGEAFYTPEITEKDVTPLGKTIVYNGRNFYSLSWNPRREMFALLYSDVSMEFSESLNEDGTLNSSQRGNYGKPCILFYDISGGKEHAVSVEDVKTLIGKAPETVISLSFLAWEEDGSGLLLDAIDNSLKQNYLIRTDAETGELSLLTEFYDYGVYLSEDAESATIRFFLTEEDFNAADGYADIKTLPCGFYRDMIAYSAELPVPAENR